MLPSRLEINVCKATSTAPRTELTSPDGLLTAWTSQNTNGSRGSYWLTAPDPHAGGIASPPVLQLPTWSDLPGYEPGSIRPVLTGSEWFSPVLTRAATSGNPKATKPQPLAALRSYSPQKYRLGSAARLLKAG